MLGHAVDIRHRLVHRPPQCLVEQAVNAALSDAFDQAQALLLARLGDVTLAQLAEDFDERCRLAPAP